MILLMLLAGCGCGSYQFENSGLLLAGESIDMKSHETCGPTTGSWPYVLDNRFNVELNPAVSADFNMWTVLLFLPWDALRKGERYTLEDGDLSGTPCYAALLMRACTST